MKFVIFWRILGKSFKYNLGKLQSAAFEVLHAERKTERKDMYEYNMRIAAPFLCTHVESFW